MANFPPLTNTRPIVDMDGISSQEARIFFDLLYTFVSDLEILSGTGSPEGTVEANPKRLYMDESGAAGSVLYIKQSGTGNTGWVLV